MVEMAYAIGVCHPISIYINTYGTCIEGLDDYELQEIVLRNFDLRPGCIIRDLDLKRPIYKKTASFGHFGRNDPDFTWEKAKDLSHELKKYKN
jgi:S-adenosylmethionine synthetase